MRIMECGPFHGLASNMGMARIMVGKSMFIIIIYVIFIISTLIISALYERNTDWLEPKSDT